MSEEKKQGTWRSRVLGRRNFHPTRVVVFGFLIVILVGALLLSLPVASASHNYTDPLSALFTATSATCVTGLVVVDTGIHWSLFGQIVILCMIQLGGLGFMTLFAMASFALHRRISLSERLLMSSAFNLNDVDGVVRLVRHAINGTLLFEGIGAVVLSIRMIPRFGILGGIWRGIFHAVSAFCNAGFDILGTKYGAFASVEGANGDPVILCTLMALIVIGGAGFFVWEDIYRNRCWRKLSLYSKMVIALTIGLLAAGTAYFLIVEFDNPRTLGMMPLWKKILNAAFQSVTLRTAGFASFDQGGLYDVSKMISCLFMLIGGSSGSTAGGIKTVTVFVVLMAVRAGLSGREEITVCGRSIAWRKAFDAVTITFLVLGILFCGSVALALVDRVTYMDALFEVASAVGTVGVTTGITAFLGPMSKVILIICMYAGRLGVLSISFALQTKKKSMSQQVIRHPAVNIMVG